MITPDTEFDSAHSSLNEPARDVLKNQRDTNQHRSLVLNVLPDRFDSRDRPYEARLALLRNTVPIPDFLWPLGEDCAECSLDGSRPQFSCTDTQASRDLAMQEIMRRSLIRNQGAEGSCTGQALASIIDILKLRWQFGRPSGCYRQLSKDQNKLQEWMQSRVSARMLYEMARNYEYAPDSQLSGSSLRNVIKAFYHNGACVEHLAQYRSGDLSWTLSVERAKNARATTLGSYYRLSGDIFDWQSALNEVGAILTSSIIHEGWQNLECPESGAQFGANLISYKSGQQALIGGHAFALVGYNDVGFFVLNSWGDAWGRVVDKNHKIHEGVPGVAIWRYDDWQQHVLDGWVFRLSHPATQSIGRSGGWRRNTHKLSGKRKSSEPRLSINGHYLNLGSAGLVRRGKYPCDARTFLNTVEWLENSSPQSEQKDELKRGNNYQSVALCFMNGTSNLDEMAAEVEDLVQVFKQNGHYPVFIFWNYAQVRHLENIINANRSTMMERHGTEDRALQLRLDRELAEFGWLFRTRMQKKIDEIIDVESENVSPVFAAIRPLLTWAVENSKKIHILAHSDGSLLLSRFIQEIKNKCESDYDALKAHLTSYQLLAPAINGAELQPISKCRKSGCKVNLTTLSKVDELADSIGGYPASYPQLLQNIFVSSKEANVESDIAGLNKVAASISSYGLSTVYSHTVAPRDDQQQFPLHFNMLSNRDLIEQIMGALGSETL